MNMIKNLEFSSVAPQRLMNAGGTHSAGGHAQGLNAWQFGRVFGSWKHLPTFNAVFKERFGNCAHLI